MHKLLRLVVGVLLGVVFSVLLATLIGLLFESIVGAFLSFVLSFVLAVWWAFRSRNTPIAAGKLLLSTSIPLLLLPFASVLFVVQAVADGLGKGVGYGGAAVAIFLIIGLAACFAVLFPLGALSTILGGVFYAKGKKLERSKTAV